MTENIATRKGREKFYRMFAFEPGNKGPRPVSRQRLRKMYRLATTNTTLLAERDADLAEKMEKLLPEALENGRRQAAEARYLRSSARKMSAVMALVRGKSVPEARVILQFTNKKAARMLERVLESAVANAENQTEWDADDLYIAHVEAKQGPTIARIRPMSMGRVGRIRKRTCHARVELKSVARKEEK